MSEVDTNSLTIDIFGKLIEDASNNFEEDQEELLIELKDRFENTLSSINSIQSDLKKAREIQA